MQDELIPSNNPKSLSHRVANAFAQAGVEFSPEDIRLEGRDIRIIVPKDFSTNVFRSGELEALREHLRLARSADGRHNLLCIPRTQVEKHLITAAHDKSVRE